MLLLYLSIGFCYSMKYVICSPYPQGRNKRQGTNNVCIWRNDRWPWIKCQSWWLTQESQSNSRKSETPRIFHGGKSDCVVEYDRKKSPGEAEIRNLWETKFLFKISMEKVAFEIIFHSNWWHIWVAWWFFFMLWRIFKLWKTDAMVFSISLYTFAVTSSS